MPRHQILSRLARHFPIVWVERPAGWRDYWLPNGKRFLQRDRWQYPLDNLAVLTTGWRRPLVFRPPWLMRQTWRSRLRLAQKCLQQQGARRLALYLWRDEEAPAVDCIPHDFSCYHIDDNYSFSDTEVANAPIEVALLHRVDQVIVHSPALQAKKGGINPRTELIPNGADCKLFATPAPEPADLRNVPHPRIGYVGVIKKQLDLALLVRLARSRSDWKFVLVGPVGNMAGKETMLAELKAQPNVIFLGGKPANELPAYVQHLDVCLMCYELNDYTKYIYPLKLNEYLAAGKPAVSSPIETVRSYSDVVTLAQTDAEWITGIEKGLSPSAESSALVEARQCRASENDWDLIVERIARIFREGLERSK